MRSTRTEARARVSALIAAGALSNFAEGLGALALVWWVLDQGGGAQAVGALAAVSLGALVVSMLAGGVVVDRFGARRVAIAATVASALLFAGLAALITQGHAPFWLVFAVAALAVLPDGAGATAFDVRLPTLARLARWPLARINAVDDVIDSAAAIAGAPAAGLIIAVSSTATALWLAFGVGVIAAIGAVAALPRDRRRAAMAGGLAPAFGWLARTTDVRALVIASALIVAAFQAAEDVVLPVMVAARGGSADTLGLVFGAAGAGGVLGALTYALIALRVADRGVFIAATLSCAAALAALALNPTLAGLFVAAFVAGVGAGALGPLVTTRVILRAPQAMRGSVLGVTGALVLALAPAAALVTGAAVDAAGVAPATLSLAAIVGLAAALWRNTAAPR